MQRAQRQRSNDCLHSANTACICTAGAQLTCSACSGRVCSSSGASRQAANLLDRCLQVCGSLQSSKDCVHSAHPACICTAGARLTCSACSSGVCSGSAAGRQAARAPDADHLAQPVLKGGRVGLIVQPLAVLLAPAGSIELWSAPACCTAVLNPVLLVQRQYVLAGGCMLAATADCMAGMCLPALPKEARA